MTAIAPLTPLPSAAPRPRALRRLAWACVLLMLTVTTASAWLRLAQPRPVCADWPGCRSAERPPGPDRASGTPALTVVARGVHRAAATAALLVSIAIVVLAQARRPRVQTARAHGAALLALALALAALGVVTPGSRAVPVLLGNQLGGFLMLALAWRLLRRLPGATDTGSMSVGPAHRATAALAGLGAIGAAVWLAQAGVGGLSGAGVADVGPSAHLALALLALPLGAAAGWAAWRRGRRAEAGAMLTLVALQAALGGAAAAGGAAAPLVLAHNMVAALGTAVLVGLTATPATAPATPGSHRPS